LRVPRQTISEIGRYCDGRLFARRATVPDNAGGESGDQTSATSVAAVYAGEAVTWEGCAGYPQQTGGKFVASVRQRA